MSEPLDAAMFDGVEDVVLPIRFRNKWMGKILLCLEGGPRRFTELQVPLKGITPKVLVESLRALERDGMLTRTSYPGIPPRVEYELTELGRSLREPREVWCKWVDAHVHELLRARAEADDEAGAAADDTSAAATGTLTEPGTVPESETRRAQPGGARR